MLPRMIVSGLIVALVAGAVAAPRFAAKVEAAAPLADASAAAPTQPLPAASLEGGRMLLARSPWARDRSAYVRGAPAPVVVAPPEVRLVAVSARRGAPRATLLVGGRQIEVGVGDLTDAGAVAAIEPDAVVLGEGRRVGLFD